MSRGRRTLIVVALVTASATAAADSTKQECLAANDRGQDLRKAGKLRAAREQLTVCIAQSCPGPVREDCADRVAEIGTAQPTIVFAAKDNAGNDLSAVHVTVDGQLFTEKLDGTALDVDPGDHTFRFEAGGAVTNKHIVVREGDKSRKETVVLGAATAAPASSTPSGRGGNPQRTAGLVVGGAGVVGVIIGSALGIVAKSTYNSAVQECPGAPKNPDLGACPKGLPQDQSATGQAVASTVAFILGGAALVGGTVLYLTASKDRGVTVGATPGGLVVRGVW